MSDLDRYVYKGRGPNKGKYLCYARHAGLPPDGYVWLPDQRKAVRWGDPEFNEHNYQARVVSEHDGYFVRLIAPKPIDVDALRSFIAQHAVGASVRLGCYWFDGAFHDAGEDFCRECAEKLVDEKYKANPKEFEELYGECENDEERYSAAIEGGSRIEHDSPPYCETCGAPLDGSLTEYGMKEEIEVLTGDGAPSFDDVEGWETLDNAIIDLPDDHPLWRKIERVVDAAKKKETEYRAHQAALSVSPGMPEARTAFMSLLSARAVQKAPEPSYRLWDEFCRFMRLPSNKRVHPSKKTAAWEKRLWKEAKSFLGLLGIRSSGDCFKAPYGTYYWVFIVQVEQYRLWSPKAFLDGLSYAKAWHENFMLRELDKRVTELPSGHEANPYPENTEEHLQWACGWKSFVFNPSNKKTAE